MRPFRRILVLGGARSGKSRFAEAIAAECGEPVLYVATAEALDDEMRERIARHRAQRPSSWLTLEVSVNLAAAVRQEPGARNTVLLEDLTLLLSTLMEGPDSKSAEHKAIQEIDQLLGLEANLVLVSNEVGMGVVPPYPLGRGFRDMLGRVNQHAAQLVEEAYLLVAGLPLRLK